MKNKGFTLIEIMVVTGISMGLAVIVFSIFMVMNTGLATTNALSNLKQLAQIAMESSQNYIEKAISETVAVSPCRPGECQGDIITFQVPIVTEDTVAGTVFTNLGELKKGAYYFASKGAAVGNTVMVKNGGYDIYAKNKKLIADVWERQGLGEYNITDGGDEGTGVVGPFNKLFNDIFGLKEAFAASFTKDILNSQIIADKVTEANFIAGPNNKPIIIKFKLQSEPGLSGKIISYETESKVTPLN